MDEKVMYTEEELEVLAQSRFGNDINIIRHAYVDIAGDLIAGALLGQILYWFEPDKNGKPKVRVVKDGHYWLVKERSDWYDEIRISVKQFDRAAKVLDSKKLIIRTKYKFNGSPMIHIRPNYTVLNAEIRRWLDEAKEKIKHSKDNSIQGVKRELPKGEKPIESRVSESQESSKPLNSLGITQRGKRELPEGENGNSLKGNSHINLSSTLLTETTTESTSETTDREQQQLTEEKEVVVVSSDSSISICEKWENLFDESLSVKKISTLSKLAVEGMKMKQIGIHNPNEKQIVDRILYAMEQMKVHSYPFQTNAVTAISNALENGYTWSKKKPAAPRKKQSIEKVPASLAKQLQAGQAEVAATTDEVNHDEEWKEINQQLAQWQQQKKSKPYQ